MPRADKGVIYLLHFIDPVTGEHRRYKHAGHYLGWAPNLTDRLAKHGTSEGARLTHVVRQAGIGWALARTWPGGRCRERQLKNQGGASRLCPLCGCKPRKDPELRALEREAAELF